jgi:hypothetical protein
METVRAYYDGSVFVPLSPVTGRVNQEAVITFVDAVTPNAETIVAMKEAEKIARDPNVKGYTSFAELLREIEEEMLLEES